MKLSVIIVNYKSPELLRLCLTSIENCGLDKSLHEIIVVDSETSRETQDVVLENFPGTKLIPVKENLGYARGVNLGLNSAQGDYLLVMNPDIILNREAIDLLLNYAQNHPRTGIVAPQLLGFNGQKQDSYFRFYRPMTIIARRTILGRLPKFKKIVQHFLMAETDPEKIQHPDWVMGSILLLPRKTLAKVGGMDEKFFLYFEDVDWARRFWENGYTVTYLPTAKVYHYHQQRSKAGFDILDFIIRKETRWHVRSAIKYFRKYGFAKYSPFSSKNEE
ncbi:MAG: hypothetical protein COV31_01370 [Candidatus Yanofskybacteria bacterium CG10_big_fil_rev_8_21_14_0_10_46_23]|uniref:Glycosyltransferase 2-like domain-containing protein n=1 Tax=Candidatus Yanofskybacteria bacterium CG10_big_fil_rev_8_21_14_0_10_46_23 TaxID=1975098 RepID=A0A2H0R4R7_9BACT|nr:MAG: hypothetical protein COV31_01370 [Candidatus Yanofskybacteria bacterium CG10_big_fil_rev_8_21_14_0_10_46_23]